MHMISVALTKALRTYSRSRLEEVCALRGHPSRADDVAHHEEQTELGAEGLAVLSGLFLAALLGVLAPGVAPARAGLIAFISAVVVCVLGYLLAGAIGRVY